MHSNHTAYFPDNITDYAPWVAKYGLLHPYGECQCGCKQNTSLSKSHDNRYMWRKGHPRRFMVGHYQQRHDIAKAFWENVTPLGWDDCWEWQGHIGTNGYGRVCCAGLVLATHRVSYELHYGSIAEGMKVLHKCDNPPCVNPYHLFQGTDADNMHDMIRKGRSNYVTKAGTAAATLNVDAVMEIRELSTQGVSQRKIAQRFNTSQNNVKKIVKRQTWKHV